MIILLAKHLVESKMRKIKYILGTEDVWSVLSSEGFSVPNDEIDSARQLVDLVNNFEAPDNPAYTSRHVDLEFLKSSLDKLLMISSFVEQVQ